MLKGLLKKIYRKARRTISSLRSEPDTGLTTYLSRNELARIHNLPRRVQSSVKIFNKEIGFPDGYWFCHSLNEIFVEEVYKFQSATSTPYIVDCGANIGLSIIYLKTTHPSATVIAFEPDEAIYKQLKSNIAGFNFENVQLINKGVWNEETTLAFFAEGTLGGRIIDIETKPSSKVISIQTVRLRDHLTKKVDFLKIDIEGSEYEVLVDCADLLINVEFLFVEYHSNSNQKQKLNEILSIISNGGFRYYIKEASLNVRHPFTHTEKSLFDLQLNIFCYRPKLNQNKIL